MITSQPQDITNHFYIRMWPIPAIFAVLVCSLYQAQTLTPALLSLAYSQPGCYAPCWKGLLPGESTWNDVRALLDKLPSDEKVQLIEHEASLEQQLVLWQDDVHHLHITISLTNEQVEQIQIRFTRATCPPASTESVLLNSEGIPVSCPQANEPIPDLQAILDIFGEPDGYHIIVYPGLYGGKEQIALFLNFNNDMVIEVAAASQPLQHAHYFDHQRCLQNIVISPNSPVRYLLFTTPNIDWASHELYTPQIQNWTQWQGLDSIIINVCTPIF